MPQSLTVNDRAYAWPARPCAVMCVDGFDMAYIDAAIEAGQRAPVDRDPPDLMGRGGVVMDSLYHSGHRIG